MSPGFNFRREPVTTLAMMLCPQHISLLADDSSTQSPTDEEPLAASIMSAEQLQRHLKLERQRLEAVTTNNVLNKRRAKRRAPPPPVINPPAPASPPQSTSNAMATTTTEDKCASRSSSGYHELDSDDQEPAPAPVPPKPITKARAPPPPVAPKPAPQPQQPVHPVQVQVVVEQEARASSAPLVLLSSASNSRENLVDGDTASDSLKSDDPVDSLKSEDIPADQVQNDENDQDHIKIEDTKPERVDCDDDNGVVIENVTQNAENTAESQPGHANDDVGEPEQPKTPDDARIREVPPGAVVPVEETTAPTPPPPRSPSPPPRQEGDGGHDAAEQIEDKIDDHKEEPQDDETNKQDDHNVDDDVSVTKAVLAEAVVKQLQQALTTRITINPEPVIEGEANKAQNEEAQNDTLPRVVGESKKVDIQSPHHPITEIQQRIAQLPVRKPPGVRRSQSFCPSSAVPVVVAPRRPLANFSLHAWRDGRRPPTSVEEEGEFV